MGEPAKEKAIPRTVKIAKGTGSSAAPVDHAQAGTGASELPDRRADGPHVPGRSGHAGADRPHRLVGDHHAITRAGLDRDRRLLLAAVSGSAGRDPFLLPD